MYQPNGRDDKHPPHLARDWCITIECKFSVNDGNRQTDRHRQTDESRHLKTRFHCVGRGLTNSVKNVQHRTRKPSYRWQTRATWKHAKNCSNSTCLQRCRWQHRSIFIRLAVVVSEICEILRKSLKIQTYRVQGHPRSSISVSMQSPYATSY